MYCGIAKRVALGAVVSMMVASPAFAQSAEWVSRIRTIIASKQTYPEIAQMRGEEGTARVKLSVGADGSVQKVEMVSSSGASDLDREAMALPHKVGALPAPPGGAAQVTLPITWKLL